VLFVAGHVYFNGLIYNTGVKQIKTRRKAEEKNITAPLFHSQGNQR
jgi:hypothetical protein